VTANDVERRHLADRADRAAQATTHARDGQRTTA
jgi:hypothetical protein